MASFCKQCSNDLFGEDYGDLKNLCKEGETVRTICEGCGDAVVNHTGTCVSKTCLDKKHAVSE